MDVRGKSVVVTGKIAGESRQTAEAKLTQAGANVQRAVSGSTDVLVMGVGTAGKSKAVKAEQLGVPVVPWEAVWSDDEEAEERPEPIAAQPSLFQVPVVAPMKCKPAEEPPHGPDWLHEVKWDGERCVATVKDGHVWMQSSTGKTDYGLAFPKVREELAQLEDCVLDGELVVLEEGTFASDAITSRKGGATGSFMVFDCLQVGGHDMRHLPLRERRDAVAGVLGRGKRERVELSPEFTDGSLLLAWVAGKKLEGIVSKRRSSSYQEGKRADSWRKIKIRLEQEFLVIGWTPGENANEGHPGAWVLAYYDDTGDRLLYAGKVGTGRTTADWDALAARATVLLHPPGNLWLSTLDLSGPEKASVTWCMPTEVVQVAFQRWTADNRLWHPSWLRDRPDKDPADVRRET